MRIGSDAVPDPRVYTTEAFRYIAGRVPKPAAAPRLDYVPRLPVLLTVET